MSDSGKEFDLRSMESGCFQYWSGTTNPFRILTVLTNAERVHLRTLWSAWIYGILRCANKFRMDQETIRDQRAIARYLYNSCISICLAGRNVFRFYASMINWTSRTNETEFWNNKIWNRTSKRATCECDRMFYTHLCWL